MKTKMRMFLAAAILPAVVVLTACEDHQDKAGRNASGELPAVAAILNDNAARDTGSPNIQADQSKQASAPPMDWSIPNKGTLYKTMERVGWCKNSLCTKTLTNSKFPQWPYYGVDKKDMRETYITVVSKPSRANVEKVVMIAAGQQTDPPHLVFRSDYQDGYPNVLTGQPDNYKNNCDKKTANCTRSIDGRSLARRLLATGKFPASKTLFIIVHDTRLQYNMGINEKQKIENAFYKFFTDNTYSWKLKQIVLAGQSRGGCLAYRLGSRFRKHSGYKTVPMILQGYDAVCVKQDFAVYHVIGPELNTSGTSYQNPYNSSYKSWRLPLNTEFAYKTKLAMQQIVGGQQVTHYAPYGVRGFSYYQYPYSSGSTYADYGWYRQYWVNLKHIEMGGSYGKIPYTVNRGMTHFQEKDAEFQ